MEGAQLDTTASLGTLNQGLASQEPTILIPDKANATYVHVDNIVRELLLVVQVDYARKATYVEKEKLYLIRRKVLRLTIITLRAEFKEFYALMAIIWLMMDSVKYAKLVSSATVIVFSHVQKVDIVTIPKINHMDYSALMVPFLIKLVWHLQLNALSALQDNIVWLVSLREHAMQVIFASMEPIHPFRTTD